VFAGRRFGSHETAPAAAAAAAVAAVQAEVERAAAVQAD